MRLEALVHGKPITVKSGASIRDAARLFAQHKIGLLIITSKDDQTRPQGVVSERDVVRAVAIGKSSGEPVDSIATKELVTVQRSDSLSKGLKKMLDHNIRHLIVENFDGTLYGVVSVRDFLRERKILEELMREEAKNSYAAD